MIIVCFGDGLGNQMFQFALYYSLGKEYGEQIVLADINRFYGSVNKHNGFELGRVFGIEVKEASYKRCVQLADFNPFVKKQHPLLSMLWGLRSIIYGPKKCYLVSDDATEYYKEVFELNRLESYMLRGNWINEGYFSKYREDLIKIFRFPEIQPSSENYGYMQVIKNNHSVSVHFRAGDFIGNKDFYNLGKDYYVKAVEIMESKVDQENLYVVFSDDMHLAKELFSFLKRTVYIENNIGKDSYRDMQLMSLCEHNIIANSTFSFWGAYLNSNPNKIVIAPEKASRNCRNAFACNEWIKIPIRNME